MGRGFAQIQLWLEDDNVENGMVMAVVVAIIVVALLRKAAGVVTVMIKIRIVVVVVIVIMKAGCRFFMIQMPMHVLCHRPHEVEGNDQHEEDGKGTTHRVIVPKSDYRLGIGFSDEANDPCSKSIVLNPFPKKIHVAAILSGVPCRKKPTRQGGTALALGFCRKQPGFAQQTVVPAIRRRSK